MSTIREKIDEETVLASPQSKARAEVAGWVEDLFWKKAMMRDNRQPLFRDRTLKQILDDNIKRFIQFKRRPAHKKDWQSNLASSTPNEKLIGILSKLATKGMESRITSLEDPSVQELLRERVANVLLRKAAIKNDDDFQIILEMLEAAEKGTVIGFEDWHHGKAKVRDVKSQDPETGELVFEEKIIKKWNDVRSQIVNIEDFYPGNIFVRPGKIQDMDDCFLRSILSKDEFDETFGKFPDAKLVQTSAEMLVNNSTPFWKQSQSIGKEEVLVLRYFNKRSDEYVILANGIWINPVGKATVSPLPWNHKMLPFWAAVYQPLDANFFYGRSFIDTLISFVDSKDALLDRILDQMVIAVSRPVLTDGSAVSATRGFLQPNNVIQTDWSNGRPNFEVVPIPDPPAISVTLYNLLHQNLEQSGMTSEVIGGRSARQKTATQSDNEMLGAMQLVSLFLSMMEAGVKDKHRLRFPNILQFYSMPIHEGDENELKFRRVVMKNAQLSTNEVGTMNIDIVPEVNQERVLQKKSQAIGNVEYAEITPEYLRNWEWESELVPQSSIKMNEQQKQILELNWQRTAIELYPDMFNRDAGFEELNRAFNKDVSKFKLSSPQQGVGQNPLEALAAGAPPAGGRPSSMPKIPAIGGAMSKMPAL